jgi:hypothetical protein
MLRELVEMAAASKRALHWRPVPQCEGFQAFIFGQRTSCSRSEQWFERTWGCTF